MKHLFVPYELALKLKEKGFDEPCLTHFYGKPNRLNTFCGGFEFKNSHFVALNEVDHISAPLYQQVIDWFRDKHNLSIEINTEFIFGKFMWQIIELKPKPLNVVKSQKVVGLYSYYEALNEGIEEALKLI